MAKKQTVGTKLHLDSRGFKKRFPVKQHKIVFQKFHGNIIGAGKSKGGGVQSKGSAGGQSRDELGRFD